MRRLVQTAAKVCYTIDKGARRLGRHWWLKDNRIPEGVCGNFGKTLQREATNFAVAQDTRSFLELDSVREFIHGNEWSVDAVAAVDDICRRCHLAIYRRRS